jgi:signal transduction histidine kinase
VETPVWEVYACTAAATANLIFALLALLRAPRRRLYRVFALTCLCVAAWQSMTLAYHVTHNRWILAAAIGGAILTTALLFHLVTLLTGLDRPRQVRAVYAGCATLALLGLLWPLEPKESRWLGRLLDAAYLLVTAPILAISINRLRHSVRRERDPGTRRLLRFTLLATIVGVTLALLDPGRLLELPIPRVSALGALVWSVLFAAGLLFWGRAHDVVRQMESLEAAIVGGLQEGVLLIDPEGRVVKSNDTARRLLGVETSIRSVPAAAVALEAHRRDPENTRLSAATSNGRALELQFSAVRAPPDHTLCVVRDVTEQERLRGQLEQNRRLAALGGMMAAVAHEIRNPLASVKGTAQLLQSRVPPDLAPHVDRIVDEVNRLAASLDGFRDFVRPIQPDREPVDLPALLRRTVEFMNVEGLAVEIDATSELPRAQADPSLLRQVFMNLLRNAREAGAGRVRVALRVADRGVRIEFDDDGPGIPADLRERAFEPFFTTKSAGSGLGLAISRRILEAHGGAIDAPEGRIVLWLP